MPHVHSHSLTRRAAMFQIDQYEIEDGDVSGWALSQVTNFKDSLIYLNAKVSQPLNICVFFSMVQVRIFI